MVITTNDRVIYLDESGIRCLQEMDGKTIEEISQIMKKNYPKQFPTGKIALKETIDFVRESIRQGVVI